MNGNLITPKQETHFYIENGNVYISEDMRQVFDFLSKIEDEVKTVMNIKGKVREIYEHYRDLLGCTSEMAKILKENKIKFDYKFKEDPSLIIEKIKINLPIRSQMIVLFASLEVLYFLYIAYEIETSDENQLKDIAMKDKKFIKKFLNLFIFTDKNNYYKDNVKQLSKINSTIIKNLRNSLTHFFSIPDDNLIIIEDYGSEKVKKMEKMFKDNKHGNIAFISPSNISGLISSAHRIMFENWDIEFRNNSLNFHKKIQFVIELVKTKSPYIILEKGVNL